MAQCKSAVMCSKKFANAGLTDVEIGHGYTSAWLPIKWEIVA